MTAFRHFYLFFRVAAFIPVAPLPDDESGQPACFLDHLRAGSAALAKEVGDRLRDHIFNDVFPYLAQGFVDYRKKKHGETTKADDPFLDEVYDATLTLLYRLLFLLYAESLDLVPVHEPAYNGGLFETSPQRTDRSREAEAARFLEKHRVPDFFLAHALDLLARSEDAKSHALVFVDYKALGVSQLGNIYEGLLVYHLVIPGDDWERGFQRKGRRVALVPSNKERKSSGSYFTPQHIVKYLVANTVGPLLTEKFDALAPKMRPIQREYQEARELERKRAAKTRSQPRTDDSIAFGLAVKHEETVWDVFDLKVLDPAMGRGHFLVETVDFITDKVLDFLAGFPWNPVQVLIDQRIRRQIIESLDEQGVKIHEDRLTDVNLIKRLVMKRCVYGVDLNPMAVELAKVSLWLDSFTLGAPLSFMDHHLKCGNSLIGATIADLEKASEGWMYGIPIEPLERATRNMEQIADLTDATPAEVTKSAETHEQVLAGVEGYRALLDCLTAEHFGAKGASQLVSEGSDLDLERWSKTVESLPNREQSWVKKATEASRERRFFHWDIGFPDVFFTHRGDHNGRRFDAIVGNPPYDVLSSVEIGTDVEAEKLYYRGRKRFASGAGRSLNVWRLFICQSVQLLGQRRRLGFIIPLGLLADESGRDLRKHLLRSHHLELVDAFPQKDDPKRRVFEEAKLSTCVFALSCEAQDGNRRIVYQRVAPQDNYRRLIGTLVRSGSYCADTVHYVPQVLCSISQWTLLSLWNSSFEEWFFPLLSSNNDISKYKADALPAPVFHYQSAPTATNAADASTRRVVAAREHHIEKLRRSTVARPLDNERRFSEWADQCDTSKPAPDEVHDFLGVLALRMDELCQSTESDVNGLADALGELLDCSDLDRWTGISKLPDIDYMGWDARFPEWRPDDAAVADGYWFPNGVAPPIDGTGPGETPFDLIACVYPSYSLPGIDHDTWEAGAWEELCDLLRKNKSKIGRDRIRADLTGRGAITHPTGPMGKLQETFFKYHRDIRENRAKAAEIDFLIDRIVFRLFDLTLDEQKLILSRVGPGRPLPPRRGRRKKSASKEELDPTPTLFD